MSAFSDISAALKLALDDLIPGRVYRGHAWPMPDGVTSMAFVRPDAASMERAGLQGGPVDWRTSFAVELRARYTPDTQAPDEAIDPLIAGAYQRLYAVSIPAVQEIVPSAEIRWDYSEAEFNVIGAVIFVQVVHRTQPSTLTAWT